MAQDVYWAEMGLLPPGAPGGAAEKEVERRREAYDKAHEIRKFEIEMYWKRSAYMWTLQAAALAGFAVILSRLGISGSGCAEDGECPVESLRVISVVAIWHFGLFSAFVWVLMLSGARHWQATWEQHVDMLENEFSGALYKTYIFSLENAPYGISQLNSVMAYFAVFIWVGIGLAGALVFLPGVSASVWIVPGFFVPLFLFWYFEPSLRKFQPDEACTEYPVKGSKQKMLRRRPDTSFAIRKPKPK